jgi:putative phosphoribosyl transferase
MLDQRGQSAPSWAMDRAGGQGHQLEIPIGPNGKVWLQGELTIPTQAKGLVLFAHGSGSSRFSSRNQFVAGELNAAGFGTCLFDLLSLQEEREDQATGQYRFDIPMLAQRLVGVTDWLVEHLAKLDQPLNFGYFGASTGAAAALIAAAERPQLVKAVVSRGGRPDMASHILGKVQAPTLLLVGGLDDVVIELNRLAYRQLSNLIPKEMMIISGATHLFEEPGKLAAVAQAATVWFEQYLGDKKTN